MSFADAHPLPGEAGSASRPSDEMADDIRRFVAILRCVAARSN
jgi:hypothetical protein